MLAHSRYEEELPVRKKYVWIVLQDKTPNNSVLGVFETMEEASEFSESPAVSDEWGDSVIYSSFPIGYRYNNPRRRRLWHRGGRSY